MSKPSVSRARQGFTLSSRKRLGHAGVVFYGQSSHTPFFKAVLHGDAVSKPFQSGGSKGFPFKVSIEPLSLSAMVNAYPLS